MDIEIHERGCGFPEKGGLYFAIETAPYGIDPRQFLLDPIQRVSVEMGIKKRGLTLIELNGVWHVVDWVGENNYPNAADWFMEFFYFGFHQRIETTLNFRKLTAGSVFFMVHPKAHVPNQKDLAELYEEYNGDDVAVPVCWKEKPEHAMYNAGIKDYNDCCGLLWQHIVEGDEQGETPRLVKRTMPSFSYLGYKAPKKIKAEPGFFAAFPIAMMKHLIYKGDSGEHEFSAETAIKNGLDPESIQFVDL